MLPIIGCQDGTLAIKTLLHLRHNHNLPSYVVVIERVKVFDTVSHTITLQIVYRYGAPPKLISVVERMYVDLKVILKIGKVEKSTSQTVGSRQGNYISPVLFLCMVMDFAEIL